MRRPLLSHLSYTKIRRFISGESAVWIPDRAWFIIYRLSSANGDKQIDRRTNRMNRGVHLISADVVASLHVTAVWFTTSARCMQQYQSGLTAFLRDMRHRFISCAWFDATAHVGNVKSVNGTWCVSRLRYRFGLFCSPAKQPRIARLACIFSLPNKTMQLASRKRFGSTKIFFNLSYFDCQKEKERERERKKSVAY